MTYVIDPEKAVLRVTDVDQAIHQLAQTELRDLLCQKHFNDILENRDEYSQSITGKVENRCKDWGVIVEHIQVLSHFQFFIFFFIIFFFFAVLQCHKTCMYVCTIGVLCVPFFFFCFDL